MRSQPHSGGRGDTAIEIAVATPGEIELILAWAAAEGWNPGIDDAAPFAAADAAGFLAGRIDGEMAASISVVRYGDDFSFLGFYICRPDLRGRGHGGALWRAGMEHLSGRTIGLDGVVAQQDNYAKSGFAPAHRNIRFGGTATSAETGDPRIIQLGSPSQTSRANAIIAYDRGFFPAARDGFLRAWLDPAGRRTLAYIEDGKVSGYGCIRPCVTGSKIGPLFAETPAVADRLFAALTARHHGTPIFLDVPEPNRAAIDLAERHGLAPVFETARMYRGEAPDLPLSRIFGITSFELG